MGTGDLGTRDRVRERGRVVAVIPADDEGIGDGGRWDRGRRTMGHGQWGTTGQETG